MSDPRWTVNEDEGDLTWWDPQFYLYPDARLAEGSDDPADWESAGLPPAALAALVECVRSHDTLTRARQLATDLKPLVVSPRIRALLDLLTGEGR